MSNPLLQHLLQLADLPVSLAGNAEITGSDLLLQTPYKFVAPGAATIAATGLAAAELWKLKTGRSQKVSLTMHAAAAAMRSPRYLKIDVKKPEESEIGRAHV